MAPRCSRSWELFAGLVALFTGVEAQLRASDGLCQRFGHQSALVGDKLFLAGGFRVLRDPSSGVVTEVSTNDFQSLDLGPNGTSFRLGPNNSQGGPQWKSINYTVNGATGLPKVANGAMWRDGEDLYIYEGRLPGLGPEASSSLWKYTANTSVWGQEFTWTHPNSNLPNRVSRGGSVSVSDSGLGVYLGGARIYINDSDTPKSGIWNYPSEEQLTTFDLRKLNRTTTSLPDSQKRMGAALGYLPIGSQGAIIAIGGTLENDQIRETGSVSDISRENFDPDDISFTPMQRVWIMDLATRKWYSQSTFGTYIPESRMEHCVAVASAPDFSSYNIYMFGGSTASSFLDRTTKEYFNELYILSIPSFRWIRKVFEAPDNVPAGRVQHTCHVHGKNLVILGGATQNTTECTWDEVNILDMTSLAWVKNYRYSKDTYMVPDIVLGSISNNGKVQTDPVNGWDDHDLEALFKANNTGGPMARIVAVAGGVAGGIIVSLILAAGFWHYRKKSQRKQQKQALKSKLVYEPSRFQRESRYDPDPKQDGGAMELHSSPSSVTSTFDENSGYAHPGKLWRASYHSYEVSEADADYPDLESDNDRTRLILDTKVPTGYFELGNPSTPTAMERHELGDGADLSQQRIPEADLGQQRIQEADDDSPSPISSRGSRWR